MESCRAVRVVLSGLSHVPHLPRDDVAQVACYLLQGRLNMTDITIDRRKGQWSSE
jgi:hypothetical protein